MRTFVALIRGRTIDRAHVVAVSEASDVVATVAGMFLCRPETTVAGELDASAPALRATLRRLQWEALAPRVRRS